MSLSKSGYDETTYSTEPFFYYMDPENGGYDFETGEHTLTNVNSKAGRRTLEIPMGGSSSSTNTQWVYEGRLLHTAAWGNHQTSLTGVFQAQQSFGAPNSKLFERDRKSVV